MTAEDLQIRTRDFAVRILKMSDAIPNQRGGSAIRNQIVRSGTSVGANYRAACRARSKKEFTARLGVAVEEADETVYWLELLVAAELLPESKIAPLLNEAEEILKILASSYATARANKQ